MYLQSTVGRRLALLDLCLVRGVGKRHARARERSTIEIPCENDAGPPGTVRAADDPVVQA
jgi:hypothetical protein